MPASPQKLDLASLDVAADKQRQLRRLFPEAFTETTDATGRDHLSIDFDKLKAVLGEHAPLATPGQERYGLEWPGKRDALRAVQAPSLATLIPAPEESVAWDSTQNVFIEGDNLEVLKLLQKSYYGKVKMIYIDPPYNTGNDFVYPDNYAESLDTYLRYTGKIDDQGFKTTTNSKDSGRFHSNWLRMMYPRLYVAKNLLREDGVIMISIDEKEVTNLRHICDQVFGSENFVAQFSTVTNYKGRNDKKNVALAHEYIVAYCRPDFETLGLPLTEEQKADFKLTMPDGRRYKLRDLRKRGGPDKRSDRPNMWFPLFLDQNSGNLSPERKSPSDIEIKPIKSDGTDGRWRWGKDKVGKNVRRLEARYVSKSDKWNVSYPVFLDAASTPIEGEDDLEEDEEYGEDDDPVAGSLPKSIWMGGEFSTDAGKRRFKALIPETPLEYPKSVELLKRCIYYGTHHDDLVMDFFFGSGTLGEALFEVESATPEGRRFMAIQLPEPCIAAGFETIADIAKERLRRAGAKIHKEWEEKHASREAAKARSEEEKAEDLFAESNNLHSFAASRETPLPSSSNPQSANPDPQTASPDFGFRVFKLAPSNFKRWDGEAAAASKDALVQQMEATLDHIATGATEESLLFEILLKAGYQLTCPLEKLTLAERSVWSVDGGSLFVCVEPRIDGALIDAVAARHPVQFICLDRALQGSDALKVNTLETFRAAQPEIQFRTV
jgi:adenine-specific DNA-methyltransferase